jgi:hypothetical protein
VQSASLLDLTRSDERWVRVEIEGDLTAFAAALEQDGMLVEPVGEALLRAKLPEGTTDADPVFASAARAGVSLLQVEVVRPSLETVFLALLDDGAGRER